MGKIIHSCKCGEKTTGALILCPRCNCAERIKCKQREIDTLKYDIDCIATAHIPDFHFLDYKVSTFWTCKKSPIGMCVFALQEGRFHIDCTCRYCHNPVERK
jgi:hypothetical protein